MFFEKKKLVLDIGENVVRAAVFLKTSKSCKMLAYSTAVISQEGSIGGAISAAINQLPSSFKKVSVAIGGREIFIRHITVNKVSEDQQAQQLMAEAEVCVPYEINTVHINYVPLSTLNKEKNEFLLIATPKTLILQVQQDCLNLGLECERIEPAALALVNSFEYNYGILHNQNIAILDIRDNQASFVALLNGQVYFIKNIEFGLSDYDEALSSELKLSLSEAQSLRKNFCLNKEVPNGTKEIVNSVHKKLYLELQTAVQFIKNVLLKEAPANLFLTGAAMIIPNFSEKISDIMPSEIINNFLHIQHDEKNIERLMLEEINSVGSTLIGIGSNL